MTKKARLTAILAAALAVSSMAVSAIWLDHTSGSAGSIECHGYLYSYSSTKFGADTTASSTPYHVSVDLTLSDGSADFSYYCNKKGNIWVSHYTSASVAVTGGAPASSATAHHVVVSDSGISFDATTSH